LDTDSLSNKVGLTREVMVFSKQDNTYHARKEHPEF
jgi:hypothetical protein